MLLRFKVVELVKKADSKSLFPEPVNDHCFSKSLPDNFIHSAFEHCHEYLNQLEKCYYEKSDKTHSFVVRFEFNFGVSDFEAPLFK